MSKKQATAPLDARVRATVGRFSTEVDANIRMKNGKAFVDPYDSLPWWAAGQEVVFTVLEILDDTLFGEGRK